MDFNKSILENRKEKGSPFLVAHRGVCGANVPCNTIAAYKIALSQGADVVEIDVAKSKDGQFYVFHPGMEHVFLRSDRPISEMDSSEVDAMFLVNQDAVRTSYKVPKLAEVFALLKDKVYINVDKFWTDVEGISNEIRKAGVEKQVIVKTYVDEKSLEDVKKYAPDFMFVPLVWGKDTITDKLKEDGINVIGAEVLFGKEEDECISDEYIKSMHEKGRLVWVNSIIYNEEAVISAHRTDDISLYDHPDKGWGWLLDKNIDFIQTDWLLMLKNYIAERENK
jgi:glycerophosphoryl diester phosphodiesterase